jgi:hypothetical protein
MVPRKRSGLLLKKLVSKPRRTDTGGLMSQFFPVFIAASMLFAGCESEPAAAPESAPTNPAPAAEAEAEPAYEGEPTKEAETAKEETVTGNTFGEPITLTGPIPASAVIASPTDYTDKTILVQGDVVDVCQKAGCWMVITDGEKTMRVTMKGHGFAVRKDGAGSTALIQGTLKHIAPDPDRTAHFEGESKNPEAMPEKAGLEYEIDASGVQFSAKSNAG